MNARPEPDFRYLSNALAVFSSAKEVSAEKPGAKLGSMWGTTFVVRFKPLPQIARRADVLFPRRGFRPEQVDVVHHKAGLPAVAWSLWAARLRQGYGALAPALDLRSAPSEGWSG